MKEGEKYKCIKTVVMDDGEIAYIKGRTYPCEQDGCITDEENRKTHTWDTSDWSMNLWERYFILE